MPKSGLRKVYKTVRGKHGTHRRAYYMRSTQPQTASLGRRVAGAAIGATLGAVGGALFGSAGGAVAGGLHGRHAAMRHAASTYRVNSWGSADFTAHEAGMSSGADNAMHAGRRAAHAESYLNSGAGRAHVARHAAAGAGIFGGVGAAGGAAFGAALGYAAASRLGRGGRRGGLKNEDPGHGRSLGTGSQWRAWSERPRTSPPGKERANTSTEDRLVREYMSRRGR